MYTIGLDIGGTAIKAGLVDAFGSIVRASSRPTDAGSIDRLTDTLLELAGELGRDEQVHAVGIGVPGLRASDGKIVTSPNIPCLDGVSIEGHLGDRLPGPVVARNDADMCAWGEFSAGAGAGTRHMICLTLGTGVGSGIIIDGELYNGAAGYAAEAGHMVVDPEGLPCSCGSHGCLEAMASATGIVALARAWTGPEGQPDIPEPWTAETLAGAALGGHEGTRRVFEQAGGYLGMACGSLINLLNPEAIVIGGGVADAGDLILLPAIREARLRAFEPGFSSCRILPASLGSWAGVVGAALFARRSTI